METGILILTSLKKYLFLSGITGLMIGVIILLPHLGNITAFGSGLSVCVLTVFYSIIINLLIISPMITFLKRNNPKGAEG